MKITNRFKVLVVIFTLIPTVSYGLSFSDWMIVMFHGLGLPSYVTSHGKVIDADTLKPIEGAVVWAIWMKCRPGVGSGSCGTGMVKEVLTDADGEWHITGPEGNDDPGYIRSILGILVPWNESPRIGYYKPGYFPRWTKLGWFVSYAYVNKTENLEGIILYRLGDTEEEKKRFMKEWGDCHCYPFIPVKDPEKRLRTLDFDFRYPAKVNRIPSVDLKMLYEVIGLKQAVTPDEKREARGLLPSTVTLELKCLPLLKKALDVHE
jgi:hypothetical protein